MELIYHDLFSPKTLNMEQDLIKQVAIKLCTMDGRDPFYKYVEYDRNLDEEFTFENWMKYEGQAWDAVEAVDHVRQVLSDNMGDRREP